MWFNLIKTASTSIRLATFQVAFDRLFRQKLYPFIALLLMGCGGYLLYGNKNPTSDRAFLLLMILQNIFAKAN